MFYEATVLENMGKKAEAMALYKRVAEFPDRAGADILNFYKALSWLKLGSKAEADKCAAALESAVRKLMNRKEGLDFFSKFGEQGLKAKQDSNNMFLLGLAELAKENANLAKAHFQNALQFNPDNVWAKYYLSTIK